MKVTQNTPEVLVLRFTRWGGPLGWSLAVLWCLWVGALIGRVSGAYLVVWLALTVSWMIPLAIGLAERSMLVLNATTGRAELSRRNWRGLSRLHWPLDEVQSTRIKRRRTRGPARNDPKREITLLVRSGMDEGHHKLAHFQVRADEALAASAKVSAWMKQWRAKPDGPLDSDAPQA